MDDKEKIYPVYVKWYATAPSRRTPLTFDEFCEKYNVTKGDIVDFMARPTFALDLSDEAMSWAKSKTPELLAILYEQYKLKKNPQDLKLWLEYTSQDKKSKEPQGNTYNINLFNPSDDQRKQIVERLARRAALPS